MNRETEEKVGIYGVRERSSNFQTFLISVVLGNSGEGSGVFVAF